MKTELLAELLSQAQEGKKVDLEPLSISDLSALMIAAQLGKSLGEAILIDKITDHVRELLPVEEYYNWLKYDIYLWEEV